MSGCMDVCISHDFDGYNEFYSERTVIARKPHKCVECGGAIALGAEYERASGKSGRTRADFYSEATCAICAEVRKAFVCGTWVFGMLWESIEEELFPRWRTEGPFECLAKLSTVAAREFCMEQYNDWASDR